MPNLDLTKAQRLAMYALSEKMPGIALTPTLWDDGKKLKISGNIRIKGHDDAIFVTLECGEVGFAVMTMVFDKIEKTEYTLDLVNRFNCEQWFFRCFIRDDGYLVLDSCFDVYEEQYFAASTVLFFSEAAIVGKNSTLKELTRLTH
ncbi:MAG: YbjN domain-containing protein [Erysipelotrichaceae bacterium]|nr:YbjN domain-containing protein [Erysipelotrichaceae bacterium]